MGCIQRATYFSVNLHETVDKFETDMKELIDKKVLMDVRSGELEATLAQLREEKDPWVTEELMERIETLLERYKEDFIRKGD